MSKQIRYRDIIDLGFKVMKSEDEVFFDEYGYDYQIIYLELDDKFIIDYDQTTRICEVQRAESEGNIVYRKQLTGLDEVKEYIKMFKGNNVETNYTQIA